MTFTTSGSQEDILISFLPLSYAEVTSPWDQRYMESFDIPTLIELTKAANYLYIADLLDLCCKTIAGHMVGLSVEELRLKFNIKNDFTPEEEARLAAEFSWAEG